MGRHLAVHHCHIKFDFEIADGPDAADDCDSTLALREFHRHFVVALDFDRWLVRDRHPEHVDALRPREQAGFFPATHHGNNDTVKQVRHPGDQVQVAVRDRVETPGVNRDPHASSSRR